MFHPKESYNGPKLVFYNQTTFPQLNILIILSYFGTFIRQTNLLFGQQKKKSIMICPVNAFLEAVLVQNKNDIQRDISAISHLIICLFCFDFYLLDFPLNVIYIYLSRNIEEHRGKKNSRILMESLAEIEYSHSKKPSRFLELTVLVTLIVATRKPSAS